MSSSAHAAPHRPAIPPVFLAALCAWAGTIATEQAYWQAFLRDADIFASSIVVSIAIIAVSSCCFLAKRQPAKSRDRKDTNASNGLIICAFALGISLLCASMYWDSWSCDVSSLRQSPNGNAGFEMELSSDPSERDYGTVSIARLKLGRHAVSMRVIWPEAATPLASGHMVTAQGQLLELKPDDSGHWLHQMGYVGTLKATSIEDGGYPPTPKGLVTEFRDATFARIAVLGGDASGLLAGMLLGNRTLYANTELEQAFQTTGLAHLMAVSGTHLAVVTALLMTLLARTSLRRRMRSALLLLMLVFYVALTGFSPSALRACVMCAVALMAGILKRRKSVVSALALCVFVFLGLSPPLAFTMGFQLSVLAVLGLVVFGSLIQSWADHLLPRRVASVSAPIAATLAATLLTVPITVPQFAQLPLISPLANILAAPLVTAALSIGLIAALVGAVPFLGDILLHAAGAIAAFCAAIVRSLAGIPGACLPLSSNAGLVAIVFAIFAVALWVFWPVPSEQHANETHAAPGKGSVRFAPCALAACLIAAPFALAIATGFGQNADRQFQSRIVMLDVGQGDCMLVDSMGARILVDTGEDGGTLLRQLAQQGVNHLDAIVITHKDKDHAGALKELAGVIAVEHVYVHEDLLNKDFEKEVLDAASWVIPNGAEGIRQGSKLKAGEFTLTVLSPKDGGQSGNADSIVNFVEFDEGEDGSVEARGLLTGDAESEAMRQVVPKAGDIDFLKVAHHGSKGGLSNDQLEALSPEIALISVGANNKYGHPTSSTLRQLEDVSAKVYRTDRQGAITLGFSKEGIRISTEKQGPGNPGPNS